ncbi:dihydrofolate reductase [Chenggangzhangella methanolivorans]|uniref:Dihydrofolate reductase n=1 Tax=Chenggangzhangella methanolivorans TaxID=1437009 RepID=A0A9E6RCI1_9HYPH|nr:dihydrofolate reductase [Chenggangzhangella methanolivorans]QZO00718.1 dihydrofolate reductase [Chenggangzhangella methanolivorans]
MSAPIVLVAAVASNGVIGRDNGLPWRLSSDLKRFKEVTIGKPLIVGRKNHEAIGRPLPGRETIVLTRDRAFKETGVHVAHDLADALGLAEAIAEEMGASEIICAGGGEIYELFMPKASRMRLTEVEAEVDGDVFFPKYDPARWRETFREEHQPGPKDDHAFTFRDLVRVRSE